MHMPFFYYERAKQTAMTTTPLRMEVGASAVSVLKRPATSFLS